MILPLFAASATTAYATKVLYNKYTEFSLKYATSLDKLTVTVPDNWKDSLSKYSKINAVKEHCVNNGYDYKVPDTIDPYGTCTYNEVSCNNDSNHNYIRCTPSSVYTFKDTGLPCNSDCTHTMKDNEGKPCIAICTRDEQDNIISCEPGCDFYDSKDVKCPDQDSYKKGKCLVREGGVDDNNNPCDPNVNTYLEWHETKPGNGKCLTSENQFSLKKGVCDELGLDWFKGKLQCDDKGFCNVSDNIKDRPTCVITKKHCKAWGMDYALSNTGQGTCTTSELQDYFEVVFGTTYTRVYKTHLVDMIDSCKSMPGGPKCLIAIAQIYYNLVNTEILGKTLIAAFSDYMDDIKTKCTLDMYSSVVSFADCSASLYFPARKVAGFLVNMVKTLVGSAFGWLDGTPIGQLGELITLSYKYGVEAIKLAIKVGKMAITAFKIGGDLLSSGLKKLGIDIDVSAVVSNIVNFGIRIVKLLASMALRVVSILAAQLQEAVVTVFTSIMDAFMKPDEFFEGVYNKIIKFFTDPFGTIKDVINLMVTAVGWVYDTVKLLANYFSSIASVAFAVVADFFRSIGNTLTTLLSSIGKSIAKAFGAVKKFFSGWF